MHHFTLNNRLLNTFEFPKHYEYVEIIVVISLPQIFAAQNAEILTDYEVSLTQISQKPGWIEICPIEIWKCVVDCIQNATKNLTILDISIADIVAIGVTNQRETTVLWHKLTGVPLYNAIAWNDTRTDAIVNKILTKIHNKKNYLKSVCGLPLSNCFSALKVVWIMDNVSEVKEVLQSNDLLFGTLDTWILWNLTGGIEGGIHVVSRAFFITKTKVFPGTLQKMQGCVRSNF